MDKPPRENTLKRIFMARPWLFYTAACVLVVYVCFMGVRIELLVCGVVLPTIIVLMCARPVVDWIGRHLTFMTLAVFLLTAAFLLILTANRGVPQYPVGHDQFMFLFQARQMASGLLWTRQHPLADFFESFNIFTKPVYASIYFPGTSLFLAIGILLGLPYIAVPMFFASGIAALLFRIVAEILDAGMGLFAVLLLWAIEFYVDLSQEPMSTASLMFVALGMVLAWLHWRKTKTLPLSILFGAVAGLAAISRPVDGLTYGIPIGAAMLWETRGLLLKRRAALVACIMAGAAPFISLQLIADVGVTGSISKTPWTMYGQTTWGIKQLYGVPGNPNQQQYVCGSTLPQIILCQQEVVLPELRRLVAEKPISALQHRGEMTFRYDTPNKWFVWLLPLGFIASFGDIRRLVLAMQLPLFLLAYSLFGQFWPYYVAPAQPSIVFLMVLGVYLLTKVWPAQSMAIRALIVSPLAVVCITNFSTMGLLDQRTWGAKKNEEYVVSHILETNVQEPAVVLFRFHPQRNSYQYEPVYNLQAAWPDDERIIRAHDLGSDRDRELIRYYAAIQPYRQLWIFDRADDSMHYVGVMKNLVSKRPGEPWLPAGLEEFHPGK